MLGFRRQARLCATAVVGGVAGDGGVGGAPGAATPVGGGGGGGGTLVCIWLLQPDLAAF